MRQSVARPQRRLPGLDAARGIAIAGMVLVNVGQVTQAGPIEPLMRLAYGRASLLFVVLAGVGIALATRRYREAGKGGVLSLLPRVLILLIGGLGLQLLDHEVNVILPTYAALFAVAMCTVQMPRRGLLIGALASMAAGPVVWLAAQCDHEITRHAPTLLDSPLHIAADVCVYGPYPVITWIGPFLFGMWLGRLNLADTRVQWRLTLWGGGAAVGGLLASRVLVLFRGEPSPGNGFDRLISAVGHSQMPLWLASGVGSAVFVIGFLLLASAHLRRWSYPLTALGRLSLSVYVFHLLVLAFIVTPETSGAITVILILTTATIGAALWCQKFARGPLEVLMHAAGALVAPGSRPQDSSPDGTPLACRWPRSPAG